MTHTNARSQVLQTLADARALLTVQAITERTSLSASEVRRVLRWALSADAVVSTINASPEMFLITETGKALLQQDFPGSLTIEKAVRVVDRTGRPSTLIPSDVLTAAQQALGTPEIRLQDVTIRRPAETVYTFVLRTPVPVQA